MRRPYSSSSTGAGAAGLCRGQAELEGDGQHAEEQLGGGVEEVVVGAARAGAPPDLRPISV